jgi:uncharacterized protein (TIGR02677 family)
LQDANATERVRRSDLIGAHQQPPTGSESPEPLLDGFDLASGSPSEREEGAVQRKRQRVFERKPVVAYAGVENADVYQRVMRVLFENKRVLGARLTEDVIADRLRRDHGFEIASEALARHLDQLAAWGSIDRQHEAGHARNLDEFKRRRHNYAITQAGELVERFLEDLDNLRERVGALEASRLQAILAELAVIVRELESGEPDPQRLRTGLDNLRGELEALDQGASDFMAQLANVLASTEAVNDDSFLLYKDRVILYLSGFASEFRRCAQRVEDQILRVEELGVEPMLALAAAVDEPPVFGMTVEEVAELRQAEKRDAWRALSAWFVSAGLEAAPWRKLTTTLGAAIDWVVGSATRLDARRAQRIDRSAEYRHLAALALRADVSESHRVFAAVFGLGAPRHFYGIDDDPQKAELPQIGWHAGPPAPIEASLYRPGSRAGGAGRTARLIDMTARAEHFAEQCVREQAELERALERFRGNGALALSDLGTLDVAEFGHLLGWLDRALLARAGADGVVRALSADGLYELELHPPTSAEKRARIVTADGVLNAPDFRLEVRER